MSKYLYDYLIKLQAITKIGLLYSTDPYAINNYKEIERLTKEMLENIANVSIENNNFFVRDVYPTPNISVRTLIRNEQNEFLMVMENEDNGFSFPGGWCDLYDSPKDAAIREAREEGGVEIKIVRLVGILNRTPFKNATSVPEYAIVFEGKVMHDHHDHDHEINQVAWVNPAKLPQLSGKVTPEEIIKMINAVLTGTTIFD